MHPFYKCININYLKNIIFWTLVYIKFIFNIEELYSSMYELHFILKTTKIIIKKKNKEMNAVSQFNSAVNDSDGSWFTRELDRYVSFERKNVFTFSCALSTPTCVVHSGTQDQGVA